MAIGLTSGLTAVICEPTFDNPEAEPLTLLWYCLILVKDSSAVVCIETALLGARGTNGGDLPSTALDQVPIDPCIRRDKEGSAQ